MGGLEKSRRTLTIFESTMTIDCHISTKHIFRLYTLIIREHDPSVHIGPLDASYHVPSVEETRLPDANRLSFPRTLLPLIHRRLTLIQIWVLHVLEFFSGYC